MSERADSNSQAPVVRSTLRSRNNPRNPVPESATSRTTPWPVMPGSAAPSAGTPQPNSNRRLRRRDPGPRTNPAGTGDPVLLSYITDAEITQLPPLPARGANSAPRMDRPRYGGMIDQVNATIGETQNQTRNGSRSANSAGTRPQATRDERRRYHIDKEESEVVLAKFWDIIKLCENTCPSVRTTPAQTNTGVLVPDNNQQYSEETKLKLSQLTQYSETDMSVDKTQIALATANAIGSMSVLYEALRPLLTQKKALAKQLNDAMASLNKIVTVKSIHNKEYEYFDQGMNPVDTMQISTMVKETSMFRGYLREWWNRIYDTVAQLMGMQHDTRKQLEDVDFRL